VRADALPLLLYGYGSYGMAMPARSTPTGCRCQPRLRPTRLRISGVRRRQGLGLVPIPSTARRENKTNSFDDFAAAGRALIDSTTPVPNASSAMAAAAAGGHAAGAGLRTSPANFRGHRRRSAVLRRAPPCTTTTPPLTAAGMGCRMGRIRSERKGFSHHLGLFDSPYDNVAAKNIRDPCDGRPHRSARHLFGSPRNGSRGCAPPSGRRSLCCAHNMGAGHVWRLRPVPTASTKSAIVIAFCVVGRGMADRGECELRVPDAVQACTLPRKAGPTDTARGPPIPQRTIPQVRARCAASGERITATTAPWEFHVKLRTHRMARPRP